MCAIPALTRSLVCARRPSSSHKVVVLANDRPTQRTNERTMAEFNSPPLLDRPTRLYYELPLLLLIVVVGRPFILLKPYRVFLLLDDYDDRVLACLCLLERRLRSVLLLMPLTSSRFLPSYHIIITILCPTLTNERPFIYTRLCRTGSISAPVPPPPSVSPLH